MNNARPLDTGGLVIALAECGVDCVVIGGVAAHAHGITRQPSDLDVVIRRDDDNLRRAVAALGALDARYHFPGISAEERALLPPPRVALDVLETSMISCWMTSRGPLDLFDGILARNGRTRYYHDLRAAAVRRRVGGIVTDVACIDTIIESKLAAGRPKDHADVAELRRIVADRALQPAAHVRSHALTVGRPGDIEISR